jgi:Holliday junction resolvase RusA-like endonuclease
VRAISFTIPGEPKPWRRARLGRAKNGRPMHFKDSATAEYEQRWAEAAMRALAGDEPLAGPLAVVITARFMVPKTLTKARAAAIEAGTERPTRRPDSDNIAKNLDGLNGVAFRDDAQVVDLRVRKVYAASAGVDVTISPIIGAQP